MYGNDDEIDCIRMGKQYKKHPSKTTNAPVISPARRPRSPHTPTARASAA